ncbi:craniofacial development protein 2-like [Capsicum annuum]|uniref:craniofacial development protein 2-like n=1 Tax=Capsicum annuum TaxID=4072 RepID=UPI001FB19C64|nr:craniofacial development protein 2-like [Capsicum annuum]
MSINLVIGGSSWNIISAYAQHVGLDDEEKRRFWEDLDQMVRSIPSNEKLFIEGDFKGHIGSSSKGYDDVHEGYRFGVRNVEEVALLDFSQAFGLVVVNSNFPKKEVHLVTFCNSKVKTQIDFLLLNKGDKLLASKSWESGGNVDSMWDANANCIRETTREVLGVSRVRLGKHQGDWWWNEEVKGKVTAKKRAYAKLAESKDEEDKRKNREENKISR